MTSKAKAAYEVAKGDVDNLMWFHQNEGGDAPGKRPKYFESLNKSAIVLLSAAWETYVETVIIEVAVKNIKDAKSPDKNVVKYTALGYGFCTKRER